MAMGLNLRYLFGDDYPPKIVYFKGFWDVHRGTGVLTHSVLFLLFLRPQESCDLEGLDVCQAAENGTPSPSVVHSQNDGFPNGQQSFLLKTKREQTILAFQKA